MGKFRHHRLLFPGRNQGALSALLLGVFLLGHIAPLQAQNRPLEKAVENLFQAFGMGELAAEPTEAEDRREPEQEGSADTTPLGVDLKSLHLISHQDRASFDPAPGRQPVVIEPSMPAPARLDVFLEERFIGKPLSMALLSEIGKEIVLAWRESDYPLVDVYYPEQNITGGKLQIVVREAVLGQKTVDGAIRSRESYLLDQLNIAPGDRINKRTVAADLDWLNENTIRQVNLIYDRGDADGTSDIVLDVTEEKPINAYVGFANTGVQFTGEEEWSFGVTVANLFNREHLIGYNFGTDLEWDNLHAHSLFYQAYLPWRHILTVSGSYVTSESLDQSATMTTGVSKQLNLKYKIPLPRPDFNPRWRHYLSFGFDYKSTNTDLLFGGINIFDSSVAVGQFRAAYEATIPDEWGITRASVGIVGSPGDLFENNDDLSFGLARLNSEARYFYSYADIERIQRLPADFSLRLKIRAQASANRLGSTEQLLAGGYNTVRGFDESIIRGDSGIITNLELISPAFSIGDRLGAKGSDEWNFLLFYDAAAMDISEALPVEVSQSLQSAGVGLNCRFGERGFARAAYGWALDEHGLLTPSEGGKFHFGLTLSY